MKTEKQMSMDVVAVLIKIPNADLSDKIKVAFSNYRDEMYERLLECTQNLGHPAYGHSSSTTIGIDELREKTFDFLEIPLSAEALTK